MAGDRHPLSSFAGARGRPRMLSCAAESNARPRTRVAHGTHLRDTQGHDVRALGQDVQAVRAHRQGDHHRGQGGGLGPARQPVAAPRHPERARDQHAEGQDRDGDQARLGQRRRELYRDHLRGVRAARRRRDRGDGDQQSGAHRGERPVALRKRAAIWGRTKRGVPVQTDGRVPAGSPGSTPSRSSST